ncbi:MAG: RNA 2'-phosphotransferase [Pseudomonadota bacterium]
MSKFLDDTSKFLSYVLRHEPQAIGITLDCEGWADIAALIEGARQAGKTIDRDLIQQVVDTSDKKRFSISEDGLRIRAAQGHSTKTVAIIYPEKVPPEFLYHGTATRFLESILKGGLRPGKRHYVHLSQDEQTATAVGQRYGKPTVLKIEALRMHQQGFKFFLADNGVWLTDQVPPEFLTPDSSNTADSATTSRQPKLST